MARCLPKTLLISFLGLLLLAPLWAQAAYFGVDSFLSTRMNSDEMTTAADKMGGLGIAWTRQEFNYDNIGGAGGSNFGADDEATDKTIAKGIDILGLLAAPSVPSAADYGSFVSNTVAHFSSRVRAWEIMNEPNNQNQMSGGTYKNYLAEAYSRIKAIDPGATVVTGGTAQVGIDFLEDLISAGGCNIFDAIAVHPYREESSPEKLLDGKETLQQDIGKVVALINRRCPGKKIWLSELGWKSGSVGQGNQANYLARSFIIARSQSPVERILSYLLRDDGSGTYGILDSGFGEKTAFGRLQTMISNIENRTFSEEVIPLDLTNVGDFSGGIAGWGTQFSNNASVTLASVTGESGAGLQISYSFSADSAAAIATKSIDIPGEPAGLGLWINGDDSKNLWRLRFKDASGETFQPLIGTIPSGWHFARIDFSNRDGWANFGGNGNGIIEFPIKFDSVLIDRLSGGSSSGTARVDGIAAINGAIDFYAFRFGSSAAAWKAVGSGTATVCGQAKSLSETPSYFAVSASACTASTGGSPTDGGSSSGGTTNGGATPSSSPTFAGIVKSKSEVKVDKDTAIADGADTITASIFLRGSSGQALKSSRLKVEVTGDGNTVSSPEFKTDHYEVTISSIKAEPKEIKVSVGTLALDPLTITFGPGALNLEKSKLLVDRWTALADGVEAIKAIFEARDGNDNIIGGKIWNLLPADPKTVVTAPATENNWTASVMTKDKGQQVIELLIDGVATGRKLNLYFNDPALAAIDFKTLPADKIKTVELRGPQEKDFLDTWRGAPGEVLGLNVKVPGEVPKVIVKIESSAFYFALKKDADGVWRGPIELPSELGDHVITIFVESETNQILNQEKIKLIVERPADNQKVVRVMKQPLNKWFYVLGAVLIAAGVGVGLYIWKKRKKSAKI